MSEIGTAADWSVRVAQTRGERDRIFRFRFDNHLSEYGRWPSASPPTRALREAEDDVAVLFFGEADGKVVGSARLRIGPVPRELRSELAASRFAGFELHELALVDHLVVARAFRRTKLLDALVASVAVHCRYNDVRFLFAHLSLESAARVEARGFRRHAPAFNHPELGLRVPMVWPIGGESALVWLLKEFPAAGFLEQSGSGPETR